MQRQKARLMGATLALSLAGDGDRSHTGPAPADPPHVVAGKFPSPLQQTKPSIALKLGAYFWERGKGSWGPAPGGG